MSSELSNDSETGPDEPGCWIDQPSLLELIAQQCAARATSVAVEGPLEHCTYGELDVRANRLAHRLRQLGVGPDRLVAVQLERSVQLVIALVAIWRAGGGYLPLDPTNPAARRADLLAGCGADLVLAESGAAAELSGLMTPAQSLVVLDELDLSAEPDTAPGAPDWPDSTAYAIYTSGSTGRPKGVLIERAGLANRVRWACAALELDEQDRVLHKTNLAFDAAAWEIFAPLVSGATVVLAPVGAERDPAALIQAARTGSATVLQVVPSVLRLLVAEPGWRELTSLRALCSGGEALQAELVTQAVEPFHPRPMVWNTYGPTECSIDVTAARCDPAQTEGPIPIGRSLPGIRIFLRDGDGRPTPVGVPGELYVSGVGLARGYLARPDLTADRFVPNPYGGPGARLYRTGDLARWRVDGGLEHRGRIDQQVKVNGVRIEPAEVEAVLLTHPHVTGAVVSTNMLDDGELRLTGYVITPDGRSVPPDLAAFLRDRLPAAMVPGSLLALSAFPLLSNGKIDYQALAELGAGQAGRPAHIPPRTSAEQAIAHIWSDLLGVEHVGVDDDFFQLGGTSLQLTRLAARLRAVSADGAVSLRGLFAASTVRAQSDLLRRLPADSPVQPLPVGASAPLSFGQRRLWILDQLSPGGAEWVSPLFLPLPIDSSEDAGLVRAALLALQERHESLRTRYRPGPTPGSDPTPFIARPDDVDLCVVEVDRGELAACISAELNRGFDLAAGPIWRALLVRVRGERPIVLVTMHHIACDGWSSAIIEAEFDALYRAGHAGVAAVLPPLNLRYADFAAWQRVHLTDSDLAADLCFARTEYADLEPLPLPTDRPRAATRDHRGALHHVHLPAELVAQLDELGRQHAATPFMTLLTGFAVVLARYARHWDVPIGTPVAGRIRPETEQLVGFFLNSLVMRCRLHPGLSFATALDQVRAMSVETFGHQYLPFERLVEEVGGERDLSRTPMYQVAFDLHDEQLTSSGADLDDLDTFAQAWRIAKTDLTLFVRRRPDGSLLAVFEYATALFDAATIATLADSFGTLLAAAVAGPDRSLAELPLQPAEAEQRQLVTWNETRPAPGTAATVLAAFEAQVVRNPSAIAVESEDRSWSFAELHKLAQQVGRRVLANGAPALVGVLAPRGIDQVAAFLGCWLAGAGYVPLDAAAPADRLATILAEGDIDLVLSTGELAAKLVGCGRTVLRLDELVPAPPLELPGVAPSDLAYVIFTSGSTGTPKGVMVDHAALLNHLNWAADTLCSQGSSGSALFSSAAFDLVVPNIYAPLMTGQTLRLAPAELALDQLGSWLAARAPYSFLKLTPGHLEILSEQLTDDQIRSLTGILVVAGDALPAALADRWSAVLGPNRLVNEYGPTECAVGTCTFSIEAASTSAVVPIGRPLPGVRMYVLDEAFSPCPPGAAGELYVGGAGIALGYLGRPDLTAERFLPDPNGAPGSRCYRTGDLVRQRPDGVVDFLGRIDLQVKIRGYRIELEEIRLGLAAHPDLADACVVVDGAAGGRILAGFVPRPGRQLTASELQRYCAARLPDYMVPAHFASLDQIALNRNGKVDRSRMRAVLVEAADRAVDPDSSLVGEVQSRIAEVWTELLGQGSDVHGNFFASGGNSILAIRLIARLQQDFDVSLDIRSIFEGPTIAQLALSIENRIRAEIDLMSDELVADEIAAKEPNA